MTTKPEPSIVRIRTAEGKAVGAGFLVAGQQVLTCVHVVAGALGLPDETPEPPEGEVHLDFPLIAPGHILAARVVVWCLEEDIAGLKLDDAPPTGARAAHLTRADDLWGHSFRAFGFPAGHRDGVWASGVLRARQAADWVQIQDVIETGFRVEPGFSGTPVWDEQLNGVVGMAVAAEARPEVKAAFIIPTDVLARAWPDVVAQALLDADMDRLRARRDQADRQRREMRDRQRVVNLRPLDVAHFKDRLREIQALCDHLADASVRLVSVVGRGGMGKTALASRVLADLERAKLPVPGEERELLIDGILYLSARSTGLGLERIYSDVGRMLGEPAASRLAARWTDSDTPLAAKVEYLLEAMQDGLYLILLDNLEEELTEDGAIAEEGLRLFVERCLTQPGGARLLVTSREEVRLAAAALHRVRSISLREGLPEDEAIALLRDLDPQGTLGLRDAPEDDLRRAARLTRGIPRALEILAGILHEDPTASLPKLLADEAAFGAEVVEQLVAEGYRRLGEGERRIMEALAVFDLPVNETAIAYLLHPWFPRMDVRAGLRRLASGYFVSASRATSEYSLHPLDRDCAYRQIPDEIRGERGEEVAEGYARRNLELRAADFYADLRKPESEWKTIDDLAPQLAEFEHRVRAGDCDDACGVLEPIDKDYLHLWGHYARLVELRERLLGHLIDARLQMTNLGNLGSAYYGLGQFERAIAFYEQALEIARGIGDRAEEGRHLGNLGHAYYYLGQVRQAVVLYEKALAIAREINDRRNEGRHLGDLGIAYSKLGQVEQAIGFYEEALAIAREIGDHFDEGIWLGKLGLVYRKLGQGERAIEFCEKALAIAREIGDRRDEGVWLDNLGQTYYTLEHIERAINHHEKALSIAREMGDRLGESYRLLGLGRALLAAGAPLEASRRCMEALALDIPAISYRATLALGIALLHQRDPAARETFADAATRGLAMLGKTASLYEPRYALAAALVGQVVCNPRWAEESERAGLLAPALAEYRRALENCAAPGVIQDAIRDLELIRAAGIEGLEPVFELLEAALEV